MRFAEVVGASRSLLIHLLQTNTRSTQTNKIRRRSEVAEFPHCDSEVLHAPGMCEVCDMFPELQEARVNANVNFTGEADTTKDPCPATARRSLRRRSQMEGNSV